MNPESFIIETVSAKWLRFPKGFQKATCIVDLPNELALNINVINGRIEVHSKKTDGVYKLVGRIHMNSRTKMKRTPLSVTSPQPQFENLSQSVPDVAWLF